MKIRTTAMQIIRKTLAQTLSQLIKEMNARLEHKNDNYTLSMEWLPGKELIIEKKWNISESTTKFKLTKSEILALISFAKNNLSVKEMKK